MKKNIIASFIIIIISLIFLQVGVLPNYSQYKRLHSQWKINQQTLQDKQQYYSQLFTLEQKLDSYQTSVAKISSALPIGPDAPDIYQFIQAKASENGLIVRSLGGLSFGKSAESNMGTISFGGTAEGSYESLTNFLKVVERSSRLINVKVVRLQTRESKGEQATTITGPQYALSFEAHYFQGI